MLLLAGGIKQVTLALFTFPQSLPFPAADLDPRPAKLTWRSRTASVAAAERDGNAKRRGPYGRG